MTCKDLSQAFVGEKMATLTLVDGGDESNEERESASEMSDDGGSWGSGWGSEWDDDANSKPSSTSSSVDGTSETWDDHCTPVSGDEDYVDESNDAGNAEERVQSPAEIRYLELPFRTKHYFLTYIQRILEGTCFRYARTHLAERLGDPTWKKCHLNFPSSEYPADRFVDRDWLTEDEIELKYWMLLLGERLRGAGIETVHIYDSVIWLRDAAVHRCRDDETDLVFEAVELARQFPGLLGEEVGEREMADLWEYVLGDGTLGEDVRAGVELKMFTPQLCTSKYQVLGRIQTLLEQCYFDYAVKKIPDVLTMKGWDWAERSELQLWDHVFRNAGIIKHYESLDADDDLAGDILPRCTSRTLSDLLFSARLHIRNAVAHRSQMSDEKIIREVHGAIMIALLQRDWTRAFEIEIVAEMWFTKTSRKHVVDRLESVYRNGPVEDSYESRRRLALAEFLAKEEGREAEVEGREELVASDAWDVREERVVKPFLERTWSPSMHVCLKRQEEL